MTSYERLLNEAMERTFNAHMVALALNRVIDSGLPQAKAVLFDDRLRFVTLLLEDVDIRQWLGGSVSVSPKDIAHSTVEKMVTDAKMLAAATSLVFGHAMTDSAAMDCCRAIVLARRSACIGAIEKRKVTISEMMAKPHDALITAQLEDLLKDLEWNSVLKKCDFILRMCPGLQANTVRDYTFNRERLERVDALRHEVVHRQGVEAVRNLQDGDQLFLELTAYYFIRHTAQALSTRLDLVELNRLRATEAVAGD